ncbi:ATP-binding protein [Clostridioides difficile]
MVNNLKKGIVLGATGVKYLNIVNQNKAFIQNEYLIIKDKVQGNVPCEVIETSIIPIIDEQLLPKGCSLNVAEHAGFNLNEITYIAKVKLLEEIPCPILPNSDVFHATYDEIKYIVNNVNESDCMTIGIIKGTEHSQNELPDNIRNVSPLWENGSVSNQKGIPLFLNHHSFRENPHIGLFGSSGSGKSSAIRVLIEELMRLNIPGLAFDPHNEFDFNKHSDNLGSTLNYNFEKKYNVLEIGKDIGIKFEELGIFELFSLFEYVGELTEPQKNILEVLYQKGDTLKHLQHKISSIKNAFEKVEQNKWSKKKTPEDNLNSKELDLYYKYKDKISGVASLQALIWKCISLENTNIFTKDISVVKQTLLNGKWAIIRGDIKRLKMIASYLLRKLYSFRKNYLNNSEAFFPPFFCMLDEAHGFAPNKSQKILPVKKILTELAQESRKSGIYLILATQKPNNLDSTLVSQLNTKIFLRLTNQEDMKIAQSEGNLTVDETKKLPDLPSGHGYISSATLNKTYPIRFRASFSKAPNTLDPFDELKRIKDDDKLASILISMLPTNSFELGLKIKEISSSYGGRLSIADIISKLEELSSHNKIKIEKSSIGTKYELLQEKDIS